MRKILFLSMACLMALCAMAQIDAISATQGETTDWYPFGKSDRIDVTIYEQGNPVIGGKIFDLSKGNVETAFGIDPLPPIKETAKDELEDKKKDANDRMNKKAERYDQIAEVQQAKVQGNAKVTSAASTAGIYIDQATNESAIQTEKQNGLNAMEEETLKALASIQAAIAGYKEVKKNKINDIATNAKNTINALGVYYTVKDPAIIEIDKAVATAEASINNADSEEQVNNAMNTAQNNINTQLETVQNYYNQLQAAKQAANVDLDNAAADAEVAVNKAAEGYGNIETVQHDVVTFQTQLGSVKDKAKSSINAETNVDGVGQLKENTIQQIKDMQNKAEGDIQTDIQAFIALRQNNINEVEQKAATAKEEINGLGVDESAKIDAKAQIDNIVNTAKQTINAATSEDEIDDAKTEAIAKIHDVVQTTKNMWVTLRTGVTAGNWNTICMERNITAIDGATFWNVVSEAETDFTLEQVEAPFEAGVGYIIRYTATELKVKYEGDAVTNPVTATQDHPIQGRFAEITCDQDGKNELVNNYVVYGNQLCKVTGWVTMADHRAYVIPNIAPSEAPAPTGAPRMTMPKPNSTPTEFNTLPYEGKARKGSFKVIENGQFRIVRDDKRYTIMGVEE